MSDDHRRVDPFELRLELDAGDGHHHFAPALGLLAKRRDVLLDPLPCPGDVAWSPKDRFVLPDGHESSMVRG